MRAPAPPCPIIDYKTLLCTTCTIHSGNTQGMNVAEWGTRTNGILSLFFCIPLKRYIPLPGRENFITWNEFIRKVERRTGAGCLSLSMGSRPYIGGVHFYESNTCWGIRRWTEVGAFAPALAACGHTRQQSTQQQQFLYNKYVHTRTHTWETSTHMDTLHTDRHHSHGNKAPLYKTAKNYIFWFVCCIKCSGCRHVACTCTQCAVRHRRSISG